MKGDRPMRLGIVADVHEAVGQLERALATFRSLDVDEVVFLGDLVCMARRIGPTVELLRQAGAVGVWGNHDFGLCQPDADDLVERHGADVVAYMQTLRPTLERGDCYFSHVQPWLNAGELFDLWYFGDPPETPGLTEKCFAAVPHRTIFLGHEHRWLLLTPDGASDWHGEGPIRLDPAGRQLVVVHAVVCGHAAVFDTDTRELVPIDLGGPAEE